MFTSQRFIDSRTGEIVTQIPLSQIQHFDKYRGPLQPGDFCCTACQRQEARCSADPCADVISDRLA